MFKNIAQELADVLGGREPDAFANVRGSEEYSSVRGEVLFYGLGDGVLALADVRGLPYSEDETCSGRIFGFHIHEGKVCGGNAQDAFADAGAHYNPDGCGHPYHAGDMPPLFGNKGKALAMFYTDRFNINEIIGRTVIIHDMPDDFKSQPSGDSGSKIACGVIERE